MEYSEIEAKVREFLTEELEIDDAKINDDASLKKDLGIDSLEVVDIVVLVEKEFGFKMKPEDFKTILTYGQFCRFIEEKTA